jgi:hypothetical protein
MSPQGREYLYQLRYLLDQNCRSGDIRRLCRDLDIDNETIHAYG